MINQLKRYESKRNLEQSPEPKKNTKKEKSIFVIQKHDATNLHYDFRLEIDGVLKSWVIPKGPSTDPKDKRLAIPTEDHPVDYAYFEGVIPEGHYGAGKVIIWDRGQYVNNDNDSMVKAYQKGHIDVFLKGDKIEGGYALIKTKGDDRWLLVKEDDEYADARRNPESTEPKSVVSDQTIEELKDDNE